MPLPIERFANERDSIIACGKILGALFYLKPGAPLFEEALGLLDDLPGQWPYGNDTELSRIQQDFLLRDGLATIHQALFLGPERLDAPPWGSVYLDEESVLFGSSALEWQAFLRDRQIVVDTGANDPKDHFGLMCWAMAQLAEQENWPALQSMLEQHLLPWAPHYLALLREHAPPGFYKALAKLAVITLENLREILGLHPVARKIHFPH